MQGGPEMVKFVQSMARERGLEDEVLFESLEAAMVAAARKKFVEAIELDIELDRLSGSFSGNVDGVPVSSAELESLGRIAAQTFKQVLLQRVREAEQDKIYEEFIAKKGQLVTGTIQRFEGENIICDINRTEAILPRHERVKTETYHVGDRVRSVISDVRKVGHRVRVVLSRTHPDLIRRLFELEIPEIADHVIEIKALAREPGFRTKLAVVSYDSKVDCVGACVGIRGPRIRNIIDELNGEKIDIIRWNESPEILIMNALKPAEIQSITLDDDTNEAVVTVAEDQLSLAIGKRGQNVRLAARLTGWDVNIMGAGGELPHSARRPDGAEGGGALSPTEMRLLDQLRSGLLGGDAAAPAAGEAAAPKPQTPDLDEHDPLLDMARQNAAKAKSGVVSGADAVTGESLEVLASDDPMTAAAARFLTDAGDDENEKKSGANAESDASAASDEDEGPAT